MRGLLDLICQLPAASRYGSAVALDEEVVEALLAAEEAEDAPAAEPWRPPLDQWTLTAQMLGALINEVKALRQTMVNVSGGRARQERPFPSPRTARAAVEARRDEAYAADVGAAFGF